MSAEEVNALYISLLAGTLILTSAGVLWFVRKTVNIISASALRLP